MHFANSIVHLLSKHKLVSRAIAVFLDTARPLCQTGQDFSIILVNIEHTSAQ